MTVEQTRPLKQFPSSNPFARKRATKPEPVQVDAMECALDAAQSMPKLLTPEHVAASLGVTERTLERWRMTGDGPPFVSLSRRTVRYSEAALIAFVAARVKENTAQ